MKKIHLLLFLLVSGFSFAQQNKKIAAIGVSGSFLTAKQHLVAKDQAFNTLVDARKENEILHAGVSHGIFIEKGLSTNFFCQIGLSGSFLTSSSKRMDLQYANYDFHFYQQTYWFVNVPVTFGYRFHIGRAFSISPCVGLDASYLFDTYRDDSYWNSGESEKRTISRTRKFDTASNRINLWWKATTAIEWHLYSKKYDDDFFINKLSFSLQPTIRNSLFSLWKGGINEKMMVYEIQVGISYRL